MPKPPLIQRKLAAPMKSCHAHNKFVLHIGPTDIDLDPRWKRANNIHLANMYIGHLFQFLSPIGVKRVGQHIERVPTFEGEYSIYSKKFGYTTRESATFDYVPFEWEELSRWFLKCVGKRVHKIYVTKFRSGEDHIRWQKPRKSSINKTLICISWGYSRTFALRAGKQAPAHKFIQDHGSVNLIKPGMFDMYQYSFPKSTENGIHYNLTLESV